MIVRSIDIARATGDHGHVIDKWLVRLVIVRRSWKRAGSLEHPPARRRTAPMVYISFLDAQIGVSALQVSCATVYEFIDF